MRLQLEDARPTKTDSNSESSDEHDDEMGPADYQLALLEQNIVEQTSYDHLLVEQEAQLLSDPLKHPIFEGVKRLLSEENDNENNKSTRQKQTRSVKTQPPMAYPSNYYEPQPTCDEAMASYIFSAGKSLSPASQQKAQTYILLLRSCLNHWGDQKTTALLEKQPETLNICDLYLNKVLDRSQPFTSRTNPNMVPEICNEFVLRFCRLDAVKDLPFMLCQADLIEQTDIFCKWLKKKGLTTCTLISNIASQ